MQQWYQRVIVMHNGVIDRPVTKGAKAEGGVPPRQIWVPPPVY